MDSCTTTVSNQSDADGLATSSCPNIDISGAEDTLIIRNRTSIGTLVIRDSPKLETLSIPQVSSLASMIIDHADSLSVVSLPMLSGGTISYSANDSYGVSGNSVFNLTITSAPSLTAIDIQNSTSYGELIVSDISPYIGLGENTTSANSILATVCLNLHHLRDVGELQISGGEGCSYDLFDLRSIGKLTIYNGSSISSAIFADIDEFPTIQINDSLTIEPSISPDPVWNGNEIAFTRVVSIGNDLEIDSFSNFSMPFDGLTHVGGSISLSNNTNCTFDFSQVSDATSIKLLDNVDTLLPLFPRLQAVENIHLRGNIDTSGGPNIFPSLILARGNVTIEPWNSDFNCSKLVSQWNDGIIHTLSCNGTGNGTVTSTPTPTPSATSTPDGGGSTRLSAGALAGIGVGAGAFVLLVMLAVIWIVLHYKHQVKTLERRQPPLESPSDGQKLSETRHQADVTGTHEVDGAGIIREKPDDHVIGEVPDDHHIVELPAGTTRET
ncbi:hypothetical protein F5Y07DRAFT_412064 [Xylaria sp. FL0933]|nr:hypothetical protein F5Y07DRAFT_412064 [Xylaria sp. FL0933]